MTTTEAEIKLQNYPILEARINSIIKELQKLDLRDVALSMGPSDIKIPDLTETHVQHSHKEWVDEFLDKFEQLAAKKKIISDEMADCLEKQNGIRLMVGRAGLDENESLYVELRYYGGHSVKEMTEMWPNGRSDTWLSDIRKSALQKIADKN